MSSQAKILVFAGSTRKDSCNKKLARAAAEMLQAAGATATFIDLHDFPMPLYDGDLEQSSGLPENALKLRKIFVEHSGLLISSPEYNSSLSAVLKNTIDWVSRPHQKDPQLMCFTGKVAAIVSASPGGLGGLRGLVHLGSILGNIGVLVLPEQFTLPNAYEAFDANGKIIDEHKIKHLGKVAKALVETTSKIKSA